MPRRATPQNAFSGIAELRRFLLDNVADRTWRNMAKMEFGNRVSAGTLNRIANDTDYEPKRPDIRRALGLPSYVPMPVCPKHGIAHDGKCPPKTFEDNAAAYDAWLIRNARKLAKRVAWAESRKRTE